MKSLLSPDALATELARITTDMVGSNTVLLQAINFLRSTGQGEAADDLEEARVRYVAFMKADQAAEDAKSKKPVRGNGGRFVSKVGR